MGLAQQVDKTQGKEVVGTFILKKRSKWFDFSFVLWIIGLTVLFTLLENILGISPTEIGLGKCFLVFFACLVPIVVIHEGLHGLFFWIFGTKVHFGLKLTRLGPAVFTKPDGLLRRDRFQIVTLAPQIFTIVLIILLSFHTSPIIRYALIVSIVCNLGGGFLDLYVIYWLRKFPKSYLVQDTEDGGIVYKND